MASKSIIFKAKNVKSFISWLKRFNSIDSSLLLEIDTNLNCFIAKINNEEKSVIKMSKINFDDAGLITTTEKSNKRIKLGIFNIVRFIKIMDQFNDAEFDLIINYEDVVGTGEEVSYTGKDISLKNKNLKMSIDCASLNIFKYMTDNFFKSELATIESKGEFQLPKANIEKLNQLCLLDESDHKLIEFKFLNNEILVAGKSFQLLLEEKKLKNASLKIFKDQYSNLDIENYKVNLGEDRLVFNSNDSETTTVISMAIDE